MSGVEASFYKISASKQKYLGKIGFARQKNHSRGGQSQNRIERQRVEKIQSFVKKIGEKNNNYYLTKNKQKLLIKHLIISGTTSLINNISPNLDLRLQQIISEIITLDILDINKVLLLSHKTTNNEVVKKENMIINKFLHEINTNSSKAVYGKKEIKYYLESNMIKELIVRDNIDKYNDIKSCIVYKIKFSNTGHTILDNYGDIIGILYYPI